VLVQAPDSQRGFLFGDFGNDREGHVVGYIGELHEPRGGTDYLTVRGDLQNVVDGAWSRDGTRLAAAGTSTVIVWDATTARQELEFNVSGGRITTVTFSRDATRIATGLEDGTTLVWDLSADEAVALLHLAGHDGAVRSVAFNGDGTRLLTSGSDGTLKVWDITPKHVPELLTVAGSGAIAYSTDGRLLATGTEAGDVVVYDAATGKVVQTLRGHTGQVRSVDFAAGGLVAAVSGDTVRIWELTGEERLRIEIPGEVIHDVSFGPDGRTVAAVAQTPEPTDGGGTRLYSVATGELIAQMSRGDETSYFPSLSSVDFSPDGRLLAGAAWSGVYIWSAADGAITMQLSQWEVMALAFTPDGRRLVTVGSDQASSVSRWDVTTGDRLASIPGTMGVVMDVAFIPDGETIVTGASDGTVRLWDAASLRPIFRLANGATGPIAVSPDGSRLAFTSDNDVVHVLSLRVADLVALAQARLTRSWMSAECDRYLHHPCPVETEAPQ
jgi:WD40 repeat protein